MNANSRGSQMCLSSFQTERRWQTFLLTVLFARACVCALCINADVCVEKDQGGGPQNTDLIIIVLILPVWDKLKHLTVH